MPGGWNTKTPLPGPQRHRRDMRLRDSSLKVKAWGRRVALQVWQSISRRYMEKRKHLFRYRSAPLRKGITWSSFIRLTRHNDLLRIIDSASLRLALKRH